MPYFFLYYCTVLRYGMLMTELVLKNGKKTALKKFTRIFTNIFIGLNRRATNIIPRNEPGRLSLKSNISITKQCLLLSNQLANNGKLSFMLSFHEIMKLYCNTSTTKLQFSSILEQEPKLVNSRLPKIKQTIIDYFKKKSNEHAAILRKIEFLVHS